MTSYKAQTKSAYRYGSSADFISNWTPFKQKSILFII